MSIAQALENQESCENLQDHLDRQRRARAGVWRHDPLEDRPVSVILQAIARGKFDPARLTPARRQECVHYLMQMGMPNEDLARVLHVTERTISRDRQAIRKAQALVIMNQHERNPLPGATRDSESETDHGQPASDDSALGKISPEVTTTAELLGEFQSIALASIRRLTMMVTDSDIPAYTRLAAEDTITRTYQRFITMAQRLGALPDIAADAAPAPRRPSRQRPCRPAPLSQPNATLLITLNPAEPARIDDADGDHDSNSAQVVAVTPLPKQLGASRRDE